MRARAEDDLDRCRGVVADRCGLALDPLVGPVAVAPMRTRHVISECRRPMRAHAARMSGDQLAAMEDLHRLCGEASLHFFTEQPERHRVEMLLDLDMVVEVHPAALPGGVFAGRRR